jgi:hypothetical protein
MQDAIASGPGVADRDEDGVSGEEIKRPRPEPAVPPDETVLADRTLQRRDACHEQDDDDHQVGRQQTRDAADGGCQAAGSTERPGALGGDRQGDRDGEPQPGESGQDSHDKRPLARRSAAAARCGNVTPGGGQCEGVTAGGTGVAVRPGRALRRAGLPGRLTAHAVSAGNPGVVRTCAFSRMAMDS